MSVHEQFAEDLSLYAMGALAGDPFSPLKLHLEQCKSCRRELERTRGDLALLAISTAGPKPPARARTRLMEAIRKAPRTEPARPRPSWWAALGWLASAAMVVALATLWQRNDALRSTAAQLTTVIERQKVELADAERRAELLIAPDVAHFEVLPVSLKNPPPYGNAIYSRQRGGLIFLANNLHSLPASKAYELWLIPRQGAPIPAGVFKADARGRAVLVNPPLPVGVEAKAFAITIEPEQGSETPTMPIVMMGAGG
jgi:anti-sigma-K factor RskA